MRSVYLLPIHGNWLLHAPLHGIAAFINAPAAIALKEAIDARKSPVQLELQAWYEAFVDASVEPPSRADGDLRPDFLGIIPTRGCNSQCCYCDFGALNAADAELPLDMAVNCVNWYADLANRMNTGVMKVHFFGGEPMTAPRVVSAVVHRSLLAASTYQLVPEFEISTNGQYHPMWARFLGDYFDSVVLSLDGSVSIQHTHRPLKNGNDSYSGAARTARIIGASQADLLLRICVSNINVAALSDIARSFCEQFNPTQINFETMRETPQALNRGLTKPNPYDFAARFIEARHVAEKFGVPTIYGSDISEPRWSSCPVGRDTVILSPDGNISSCYLMADRWHARDMELSIGQIGADGRVSVNSDAVGAIRTMIMDKPRCLRCFCRWSCAGGCHVDNTWPGSPSQYSDNCLQSRVISACTLLNRLGLRDEIEALIDDLEAMQQLAERRSDLLADWP
jgi:uncharacterized protein